MDWQGQSYNFLLNFAKYSVNYEQRWTNYKLWTDFGGTWTKTASYYSSDEMLEEITKPCYKFLWWTIEPESQVNFSAPSQSYPPPQTQTSTVSWQCDKAKYVTSVNLANLTYIRASNYGICFSPDGTNLYLVGDLSSASTQYLFWFTLTTPWDITTAKFQNKINLWQLVGDSSIYGAYFSPDGQNFYTFGSNLGKIVQFYLSKSWDITTMYSSGKTLQIRPLGCDNIRFNPYGTRMYLCSNNVVEFDLLTSWDVSSADKSTGDATLFLALSNTYIYDCAFKSDGSGIYLGDNFGNIYYCDLPTPWSLSNYIYKGVCFSPGNLLNTVGKVSFWISSDGKFAYTNFAFTTQIHMFTSAT